MAIIVASPGTGPGSIVDYASLETAVGNWLNRSDLTSQIADFIQIAESRMNRELRNIRSMEAQTTISTVAGTSTVSAPADLIEMRRLVLVDSTLQVLKYLSADELSAKYWQSVNGRPEAFTVIGQTIELGPTPDAVYSIQLTYFQKIAALSPSNTTNWLLTAWPDAYLWGSLLAAQPFLMNDARLPMFEQLYERAISGINNVDWYSGSTMRVVAK